MDAPICRPLLRHVDLIGRCFITIQARPRCCQRLSNTSRLATRLLPMLNVLGKVLKSCCRLAFSREKEELRKWRESYWLHAPRLRSCAKRFCSSKSGTRGCASLRHTCSKPAAEFPNRG